MQYLHKYLQLIPRVLKCHSACSLDRWHINGNVLTAKRAASAGSKRTTRCSFAFNVIVVITFIVLDFGMFRKVRKSPLTRLD